ncbi:MAG: hypothetical protein GX601_15005 [Anaerolineales bacterium]|nr:hypothetical protein [Anaerolineales bacterium]
MVRLDDIVSFRRDLLFSGAVQVGWLESNPELAAKAAGHFAFHGPSYHGVAREALQDPLLRPVDTATFVLDVVERTTGHKTGEPFAIAVAGYGTGKSHLGVTLASLLGAPGSALAERVIANLQSADREIGGRVRRYLGDLSQPFLVVAINGMRDFDLTGEIVRQVLSQLRGRGLDTSALEDLRPRFRYATNFVESFYTALRGEFEEAFGKAPLEAIVGRLEAQDEETFDHVSRLHERKMGAPLRAVGQESLHDVVRVVRDVYCGKGRPFAGMLVLFDEFGRYMEFAVQKPGVAGPGALQQLHEAVQANADGVFLLCFIQYELKAYISRVAPELRDDLQRYVTRYDAVPKARLSTNLETLIANLLEKHDPQAVARQVAAQAEDLAVLRADMLRWYPDMAGHGVWADAETFERVVRMGCWPLHPLSTLLLYRLASAGRSLQQRSALSLLADAYEAVQDREAPAGFSIAPVDLCGEALVEEFVASERSWQQGAAAQAYRSVLAKFGPHMSADEERALRAVLLLTKTSARLASKNDCLRAITSFSGRPADAVAEAVRSLESERGALSWNEGLGQYEIVSDAVPRAQFLAYLEAKVADVTAEDRARIFGESLAGWLPDRPDLTVHNTDYGADHDISTKEWGYRVSFTNIPLLAAQIENAFRNWRDARGVDQPKGELIYCYVGRESNLAAVREGARDRLRRCVQKAGLPWEVGVPIAIVFLHDKDGALGAKVAEHWVLERGMEAREAQRFENFVPDRKGVVHDELANLFENLRRQRDMVFATGQEVPISLLTRTLAALFERVYAKSIPFPFDGFTTERGNAATDCAMFTRELFLGRVDREWITARQSRERNRVVEVLDSCWGALDGAGAVRLLPAHPTVRAVIEGIDARLDADDGDASLCLGAVARELCLPPYGCNIAATGLVLALYVAPRRDTLEVRRHGEATGIERWLQDALPRRFLELSVLDTTEIVRVSEKTVGEWARLLNAWEIEATHAGKVEYWQKALVLRRRLPVPQVLHYQFENLCLKAKQSQQAIQAFDRALDDALEKETAGAGRDDVGLLAWGAAMLHDLRVSAEAESGRWTAAQLRLVEEHEARARVEVQQRFGKWLRHQSPQNMMQMPDFVRKMRRIAGELKALALDEERAALESRVEQIEDHVRFVETVRRLRATAAGLAQLSEKISDSTPMSSIASVRERIADTEEKLETAEQRKISVAHDALEAARVDLAKAAQACTQQSERHRARLATLRTAKVRALSDIRDLAVEVTALRRVFDGTGGELQQLVMIHRQLGTLEDHYHQLDSDRLSEGEFAALLTRLKREAGEEFGKDKPPLPVDSLYAGIAKKIRAHREKQAVEWMRQYVGITAALKVASAEQALSIRTDLTTAPRFLTTEQTAEVAKMIRVCDRRLDALEVEGLVARYERLAEETKRAFLERIGVLVGG